MSLVTCTQNVSCHELNQETRKKLYGQKATNREFINEIIRLRLGDTRRRQQPLNNTEIANQLGVSTDFIQEKLKLAASHGLCSLTDGGRLKLPEKTADATIWQRLQLDEFARHPLITEWIQYMRNQNNGEGLVNWSGDVQALRVICNTLKIKPDQLIVDKETTKKLWLNFLDALKENKIEIEFQTKQSDSVASRRKRYITSLRRFCSRFGITWAKGEDEVMGNKVVNHGQYAHIRMTDEEFELADNYLKSKYGTDSDLYRIFWVGVESCARDGALFKMALEWDKILDDEDGSEIFVMRAFESKTKKYNGGWWEKFITRKETQDSLRAHKQRGNALIWTKTTTRKMNYKNEMRQLFAAIGKIPNYEELQQISKIKRKTGNYFFDKPIHALRHIGAHYWLAKTDYDYAIVAEFGGWMTIDELKKSYGAMPPEMKYKKLKAAKHKMSGTVAQTMQQIRQAEVI